MNFYKVLMLWLKKWACHALGNFKKILVSGKLSSISRVSSIEHALISRVDCIDYELTRDGFQGHAMADKILSLCRKVIEADFIPVAVSGDMGGWNVAT